jgi:hypothetical protein
MSGLTPFQEDVARLFFSLPASDGFLLAGGGALLATGLSTRPTEDRDFFGERGRRRRSGRRPVRAGGRRTRLADQPAAELTTPTTSRTTHGIDLTAWEADA